MDDTKPSIPAAKPWHDGLPEELVGHATNRGLLNLDPVEVSRKLIADHRNAQQEISRVTGIPHDQLAYIPKDSNDPKWNELFERLGAPKEATGYDFAPVKFKDGTAAPEDFITVVRDIAAKNHLTVAQAQAVAAGYIQFSEGVDDAAEKEANTRLGAEQLAVKTNWGANYQLNEFVAGKGAEALGLDKDMLTAIQGQVGYQKTMDTLLSIGQKLGEAALYKGNGNAAGAKGLTQAQAVVRKAELMQDRAWVTRYLNSDVQATGEMNDLNKIIVGASPAA